MKPVRAWHFVSDTLRDGSPIPPDGKKLIYKGNLKMCESGLHASIQPFDALRYAPGNTLCYVECGGEIMHQSDKLVCRERTIIARMDATEMLRYFARMQALSVIHLYPNGTDDAVFDYLITGNELLRSAAWSAADSAARSAADSAARSADSAAHSACSAAWSAARSAARQEFNALVYECFEGVLK